MRTTLPKVLDMTYYTRIYDSDNCDYNSDNCDFINTSECFNPSSFFSVYATFVCQKMLTRNEFYPRLFLPGGLV